MRIDWSTLMLQTINVLVLVWLLARFLFRPVAEIVAKRQDAARRLLDEASAVRAAAEADRSAVRAEAERLAGERGAALREAQAQAAAERAALVASAHDDANKLRAAAAAELEASRAAQAHDAGEHATRLAVDIASKLLDRLPDGARVAGFIDGLAEGLARLPSEARAELGRDGVPLRITAARALSAQEETACRAALATCLARPVAIDVHVDPALIAGLELDAWHVRVRNSFRHDLEQIEAALLGAGQG